MHCLECGPIHFDDTSHGTLDPDQEIVYGQGVDALANWAVRVTRALDEIVASRRTDPGIRLYLLVANEAPYYLGPLMRDHSHLLMLDNPDSPEITEIANKIRGNVINATDIFASAQAPLADPEACPVLAVHS